MDPSYQFESVIPRFMEAGCEIRLEGNIVTAEKGTLIRTFRLPPLLKANNGAIPGWFLAGIWDEMMLPSVDASLEADYLLGGWGFDMPQGARVWLKDLPADPSKVLIYSNGSVYISGKEENLRAESRMPPHADLKANVPRRSVFHIVELFEKNGWFNSSEKAIPSQDINRYIIAGV
jgi:hypothetical protein